MGFQFDTSIPKEPPDRELAGLEPLGYVPNMTYDAAPRDDADAPVVVEATPAALRPDDRR